MTDGEKIFDSGRSDEWMTYAITEKDGEKIISWGRYWYCADGDEETGWRCVSEDVEMPLSRFMALADVGKSPVDECPEEYNRPCDYIEDLSEEEAREEFRREYDYTPKLDWEYITLYTQPGCYIGRYAGLRR